MKTHVSNEPLGRGDEMADHARRDRRVAYLLWATLELLGAHRWWWGKLGSGLAQLALSVSAGIVFTLGAYNFVAKLFVDHPQMTYGEEIGQIALGLGLGAAALAWLVRDGLRIKTWAPKQWRLDR